MKKVTIGLLGVIVALAGVWFSPHLTHDHELCTGMFPDWDATRSIEDQKFTRAGLDEDTFNAVLDKFEAIYEPMLKEDGITLNLKRLWSDDTINASAQRGGEKEYIINMYGGLARHESITPDGFMVVACHEVGHHIGGAPKVKSIFGANAWASNEGQSDYYAGLHCFRKVFTPEENLEWATENEELLAEHPLVMEKCSAVYESDEEQALCARTAMAGFSVTSLFAVEKEQDLPAFDTPDENTVNKTDSSHPAYQCRLDTYFASGLCTIGDSGELDGTDPKVGTCTRDAEFEEGIRPLCWFQPNEATGGGGDGGFDICDIFPLPGLCD